jgi:single-strand DNA-binding protein
MYSQLSLIGYVGSEAKSNTTQKGGLIASCTMAVNQGYGERKKTIWIKVKAFDKTAERMANWPKGCKIFVTGELDEETWTDQAGKPHHQICVIANRVLSLEKLDPQQPGLPLAEVSDPFDMTQQPVTVPGRY